MDTHNFRRSVLFILFTCNLISVPSLAADKPLQNQTNTHHTSSSTGQVIQKTLNDDQLCALVAPIALFPDSVLSHILIASTYPLEVVEASRWVEKEGKGLLGSNAIKAVDKMDWDPSVKRLVAFPDVLTRMSEDLDWTLLIGDSFLADENQVLSNIQYLRQKALAVGSFKKMPHLNISQKNKSLLISFSRKNEINLPFYNTLRVYGAWWIIDFRPANWVDPNQLDKETENTFTSTTSLDDSFYSNDVDWSTREILIVNHYEYLYPRYTYKNYGNEHKWHHDTRRRHNRDNDLREHRNYVDTDRPNDSIYRNNHDRQQTRSSRAGTSWNNSSKRPNDENRYSHGNNYSRTGNYSSRTSIIEIKSSSSFSSIQSSYDAIRNLSVRPLHHPQSSNPSSSINEQPIRPLRVRDNIKHTSSSSAFSSTTTTTDSENIERERQAREQYEQTERTRAYNEEQARIEQQKREQLMQERITHENQMRQEKIGRENAERERQLHIKQEQTQVAQTQAQLNQLVTTEAEQQHQIQVTQEEQVRVERIRQTQLHNEQEGRLHAQQLRENLERKAQAEQAQRMATEQAQQIRIQREQDEHSRIERERVEQENRVKAQQEQQARENEIQVQQPIRETQQQVQINNEQEGRVRAERERQAQLQRDQDERERAERDKQLKSLQEQEQLARVERERAEEEKEKEKEKERQARAQHEQEERAEKEKQEQDTRDRAERERLEREKQVQAERERVERENADRERQAQSQQEQEERERAERERLEKERQAQQEQQAQAQREKEERDRAERERIEKEKKEQAEREERERQEREKQAQTQQTGSTG